MICSAMPVLKPVMTALETKFMIDPKRRRPKINITTPTTMASAATLAGSAGSSPDSLSTLRDDSAIALVSVVTIKTVREKTEATMPTQRRVLGEAHPDCGARFCAEIADFR